MQPVPPENTCATLSKGNAPIGRQPARDRGAKSGRAAPVATQPIEGGNCNEIKSAATCICHQSIESGSPLARAADGVIDKLADDRPAGTLGMFAKGAKLILGGPIGRRDPSVKSGAHPLRL